MHFRPFCMKFAQNNKSWVEGQYINEQKSRWLFLGSAKFLGHTECVKWPKGPKMANFKYSLSAPGQIGNIVVKNFQDVFRQSAQIRVSYYLDIGNFFCTKKFYGSKTQILGNGFLGLKFFPDLWAQIGQQQIFIIWQDGQTPHQLFFTNVSPNGPTGNQSIFGSQIEKTHFLPRAKLAISLWKTSNTFFDNRPK